MTRIEALTRGVKIVNDLAALLPRRRRGTAPDRIIAAVAVADFLYEDDGNGGDDGPEPPADIMPSGPLFALACEVEPADRLTVYSGRTESDAGNRSWVSFLAKANDGSTVQVAVSPSRARAFGAAVLNAADQADGTTALNFIDNGGSQ